MSRSADQNPRFITGGGQFWSRDVPRSIAWYSSVLGFEISRDYQRDGRFVYVHLQREGALLLISDQVSLEDGGVFPRNLPVGGHVAVRIEVHGIDALLAELTERIQSPPPFLERRRDRVEIQLVDPDGWSVVCWQRTQFDTEAPDAPGL